MKFLPDLLTMNNGKKAESAQDWSVRREEILNILAAEEYGFMPPAPKKVTGTVEKRIEKCCSGHAVLEKITVSFDTPKGEFSFPVNFFVPVKKEKSPLILMLNFRTEPYDKYYPAEEIIDNGFALAAFNYEDVTSDDGDFENGIAGIFERDENTGWGKISMWAYAASRVIDCLSERSEVDSDNIAVAGHSRLGKTALWCAANDERVKFVLSNGSGCSGASYERAKHEGAETVADIVRVFPYWFCGNYKKYVNNAESMPFDQHFLIAACAPRYVCVGDASKDAWADQYSEQLACVGASEAWKLFGKEGYTGVKRPAEVGERFAQGEICYHLRDGIHFFGRPDWLSYMKFIKDKMKEDKMKK